MTGGNKQLLDFLENPSFRGMVLHGKDVIFWEEWLKQNPKQLAIYELAVRVLKEINDDTEPWDSTNKAALLTKLNQNRNFKSPGFRFDPRAMVRVMIVVAGIGAGIFWWYMGSWKIPDNKVDEQSSNTVQWIVKTNPAGQKSKMILPDGSSVTLNSASEMTYSTDFAKKNREVHLKGEAFFEVVRDSLLAFEVFTDSLVTQALGTSFNIKNYPEMPQRVQLTAGSVSVSQENNFQNPILLHPGEEAVLAPSKNLQTQAFDISKATLWKEGILHFDKASFEEVITTLERWYGVDIVIENLPRRSFNVTAEFQKDYLENVLHSLGFTFEFNYEIDNKKVTIKFNSKTL